MKKNMFKIIYLISLLSIIAIVFAACSSEKSADTSQKNFGIKQYDMPEEQADIMGIVKSMVGNEVTITQYDLSEMPQMQMTPPTEEQKAEFIASGGMPGMGGGMRGMGQNGGNGEDRASMFEDMETLGDIKVTIPVGIQMTKMGSRTQGESASDNNATLEDVGVGGMITIWLNDEMTDRKVAEFVMVRNM